MDKTMFYLEQVDLLMKDYKEIPPYREIFEATNSDVEDIVLQNTMTERKTTTLLQKACNAIKAIFRKIKEAINSALEWFKAGKDEIRGYKDFVRMVKEDPSLGNVKITLRDYRKINEERERLLSKEEEKYRRMKDDEVANRPSIGRDLQEGLKKVKERSIKIAKEAGSITTVQAALELARTGQVQAGIVQEMINRDMIILNGLEKQLGKKDIWMFKAKVKMLKSRIGWIRKIAGGRQEQIADIKGSLDETKQALFKALPKMGLNLGMKNKDLVGRAGKEAAKFELGARKVGKRLAKKEAFERRADVVRLQVKTLDPTANPKAAAKAIEEENKRKIKELKREFRPLHRKRKK